MSLLQEERKIILGNEYVESFDFAEVENFVKNANKELFISHHYAKRGKMLVQPRGGFQRIKTICAERVFRQCQCGCIAADD